MIRAILLAVLLPLSGCTNEIYCWYATAERQNVGEPWYRLEGRTAAMRTDIVGPLFKSQEALEEYVTRNHLSLCGAAK